MSQPTTNPSTTATREYVASKMSAYNIDKIIGEPTLVTFKTLFDQLAVSAAAVKTNQWGGLHGHLPLLVSDAQFQTISGNVAAVTDKRNKPNRIDSRIDGATSNYHRLKFTREQDEKILDYHTQEEVDDAIKNLIIESVDPQYIEELKRDYVGYANETGKSMLAHIKSTWCKITTREKGVAQRALREPWNLVEDITAYERALDKNQITCLDLGVPINDSDKVQIYMENMYMSDMFEERDMTEWEEKPEADKDWATAKTYFGSLFKKRKKYNSDMKARGAGFESANSVAQKYQPNPPSFSGDATVGTTTSSFSGRGSTTPLDKTQWVEYSDSLEDSLTEAKEYAASLEAKAAGDQATLLQKLEMAMEQNTKLLALMAKGGLSNNSDEGGAKDEKKTFTRRPRKKARLCKHCGEEGYHEDDQCFSLEKNKAKRPKWYKDQHGE